MLTRRAPASLVIPMADHAGAWSLPDHTYCASSLIRRSTRSAPHRTLRLPNALVIATAIEQEANHLITTDRKWPTAEALKYQGIITRL